MAIERNPTIWQIGNTGFRNAERLGVFLRLLEQQAAPLWRPGLPPIPAMAQAKKDLAAKVAEAREEDPYGNRPLMRIDPELQSQDGIGKALAAAIELNLLRGPVEGQGMVGPAVLTPLGQRFCKAKTERPQKAVFAQALAGYQVQVRGEAGHPLQRIAQVFQELEALDPAQPPHLTRHELAWCVLPAPLTGPARPIAQNVLAYRHRAAVRTKNRESRATRLQRENDALSKLAAGVQLDSLKSYANVTMLYLLFTGLLSENSSTYAIAPDPLQKEIWEALAQGDRNPWATPAARDPVIARLEAKLGVPLAGTRNALFVGLELLDRRTQNHRMTEPDADARIAAVLAREATVEWAPGEPFEMKALNAEPAAAEWAATAWLCRALTRSGIAVSGRGWRGRVDVAGRPERPAPGGDADAVIETPTHRFVVEATLVTSGQQESREGESVRRHVATCQPATDKPVWGLFCAPALDSNTLMAFAAGGYFEGKALLPARIVPLSFDHLRALHAAYIDGPGVLALCEAIWSARPTTLSYPRLQEDINAWSDAIRKAVHAKVLELQQQRARQKIDR